MPGWVLLVLVLRFKETWHGGDVGALGLSLAWALCWVSARTLPNWGAAAWQALSQPAHVVTWSPCRRLLASQPQVLRASLRSKQQLVLTTAHGTLGVCAIGADRSLTPAHVDFLEASDCSWAGFSPLGATQEGLVAQPAQSNLTHIILTGMRPAGLCSHRWARLVPFLLRYQQAHPPSGGRTTPPGLPCPPAPFWGLVGLHIGVSHNCSSDFA